MVHSPRIANKKVRRKRLSPSWIALEGSREQKNCATRWIVFRVGRNAGFWAPRLRTENPGRLDRSKPDLTTELKSPRLRFDPS